MTGGKYQGQRCNEEIFNEVRSKTPNILAVAHVMREKEVDAALVHPRVVLASDGILVDGSGHPRAAGTFPRFIHTYVKQKKLLSLYEAVAKMTAQPAKRVNINKGHLSVGADADITIFDFEAIKDMADFNKPLSSPQGIQWVLIGGEVAVQDGVINSNRLGSSIRV
ncbi:N-acyl-D-glutamate deacylase [bioreactor metagenome]|uniref:N-acyl-D-glutamate deacylase n=1 Tax=bioreactor metagenome TaxID=1076179 RepID=A0A645EBI3_9ZZZZ